MKKDHLFAAGIGVLFLFWIQMTGTLIQSIYILDLMHTSLDEKVLGTLFFFTPIFLLLFRKKIPTFFVWVLLGLLVAARGLTPYLNTAGRLLTAGVGTGCSLTLLALLAIARPKEEAALETGPVFSAGLALGISFSVLLRALLYSIDYSLTPEGGWVGLVLGLFLAGMALQVDWQAALAGEKMKRKGLVPAILGVFLILALIYFAFSAPAVIARWTGGDYALIVSAVSLLASAWGWVGLGFPRLADRISRRGMVIINLVFTLSLVATIMTQQISFPTDPGGFVVAAGRIQIYQAIPLVVMLLSFPVLFLDMHLFINRIRDQAPSEAELVPGLILGSFVFVALVFINIFTNVWGYIPPVSTPFRNQFYLPFAISAGVITLLAGTIKVTRNPIARDAGRLSWGWAALLSVIFIASASASLHAAPAAAPAVNPSALVVMTYNIQAGNDDAAEPAFDRQLDLIRQVSPDILALQESDTARIGLNNNDLVRFFASSLGYFSYYGPTTVTGTFGTAILSKYPLQNPRTVFTFSDTDEIGTAEAEFEVANRRFTICDVHPDGSVTAKVAFAQALLNRAGGKDNVIALGDYNSRKGDPAYELVAKKFTSAWTSVNPSGISSDGNDWIDHIFLSSDLEALKANYILPPVSATDHPVLWAEIGWQK